MFLVYWHLILYIKNINFQEADTALQLESLLCDVDLEKCFKEREYTA